MFLLVPTFSESAGIALIVVAVALLLSVVGKYL